MESLEKPKKEKLLLLIPENIDDRVSSVGKTKIPSEFIKKKVKGVSRIESFKRIIFLIDFQILHIPFDEHNNFK